MTHKLPMITVGQLRKQLALYPDDFRLEFQGLAFIASSSGDEVQVEFNQMVYLGSDGRVVVVDHLPPQSYQG